MLMLHLASIDENAFKAFRRAPDVGQTPDLIQDDLPRNMDYIDASFGAAGGLREMTDDDLLDFDDPNPVEGHQTPKVDGQGVVIASVGGETIRILNPSGIRIVENYFDNLPPDAANGSSE